MRVSYCALIEDLALPIAPCVHSWYELYDRQRAAAVNARLLAYVRQLEQMKRELEEGISREAEAQAAILAAKARFALCFCSVVPTRMF